MRECVLAFSTSFWPLCRLSFVTFPVFPVIQLSCVHFRQSPLDPNALLGSGNEALNVNDVRGPGLYEPGYDLYIGWKFSSGIAVEVGWRHLQQAKYSAAAALVPNDLIAGGQLENTFLFAPVNNFG